MHDESDTEVERSSAPRKFSPRAKIAAVVVGVAVLGGGVVASMGDDDPNLDVNLVSLEAECTQSGAAGVVTNLDEGDVTAVIEVEFYGPDGEFLHKASATRPGIAPGASSEFSLDFDASVSADPDAEFEDCTITVPSVFRFNR